MGRILTISALLVSLLAIPAMCMGGVITHECECTSESVCACEGGCESEPGCEHESDCGHEGGCPDDPCSIRVVRPERRCDCVVTVAQPTISPPIVFVSVVQPSVLVVGVGLYEWSGDKKPPFPPSDLPFLI